MGFCFPQPVAESWGTHSSRGGQHLPSNPSLCLGSLLHALITLCQSYYSSVQCRQMCSLVCLEQLTRLSARSEHLQEPNSWFSSCPGAPGSWGTCQVQHSESCKEPLQCHQLREPGEGRCSHPAWGAISLSAECRLLFEYLEDDISSPKNGISPS